VAGPAPIRRCWARSGGALLAVKPANTRGLAAAAPSFRGGSSPAADFGSRRGDPAADGAGLSPLPSGSGRDQHRALPWCLLRRHYRALALWVRRWQTGAGVIRCGLGLRRPARCFELPDEPSSMASSPWPPPGRRWRAVVIEALADGGVARRPAARPSLQLAGRDDGRLGAAALQQQQLHPRPSSRTCPAQLAPHRASQRCLEQGGAVSASPVGLNRGGGCRHGGRRNAAGPWPKVSLSGWNQLSAAEFCT